MQLIQWSNKWFKSMSATPKRIEAFKCRVSYYHNQEINHLLFVTKVLTTAFGAMLEKFHWLRILKQLSPKDLATCWWHREALRGSAESLCCGTYVWFPSPCLSESIRLDQAPLFYSRSSEATMWSEARSVITAAWGSSLSHTELRAESLLFLFLSLSQFSSLFWFFLRLSFHLIDHLLPTSFLEGKCVSEDIPPLQTQEEML